MSTRIPRVLVLAVAAGSCSPGDADPSLSLHSSSETASIDSSVVWGTAFELQEGPNVITVFPFVRPDPAGYLVGDTWEAQFRIYGPTGRLKHWFGGRGNGPREFLRPAAAFRLADGSIAATDMSGKVAIFDSAGGELIRTTRIPVSVVFEAQPLDDSLVLVAGRLPAVRNPELLHVWNLKSGRLVRSFFSPPVARGLEDEAVVTGVADAAVRGDTIAVVFTRSDTLYLFSATGTPLGRMPLGFRSIRPLTTALPTPATRERLARWQESFSTISDLHWLPDGTFLVQYYDLRDGEQRWRLLHLARDGQVLFEAMDSPRLLTPLADGRGLLFVRPGAEVPNSWKVASLRD